MTGAGTDDAMDRAVVSWLSGSVDGAAPDGLVLRAMTHVAATPQRTSIVARVLGAPAGPAPRPGSRLLSAAVVAIAVAVTLVAIGVAGGFFRPRPDQTIPIPPASSTTLRTAPVTSSPSILPPSPSATPAVVPAPSFRPLEFEPTAVIDKEHGYSVFPFAGGLRTRVGHLTSFQGPTIGQLAGLDLPLAIVEIRVERVADGIVPGILPEGTPRVLGRTLNDVLIALGRTSGITVERTQSTILDNEPAIQARVTTEDGHATTLVFAIHDGRIYLIEAHSEDLPGVVDRASADLRVLAAFTEGFHFLGPARASGDGLSLAIPDGWRQIGGLGGVGAISIGFQERSGMASDVIGERSAAADTPILITRGEQARAVTVSGHDLASLLASTRAAFPDAQPTRTTIGGEAAWIIGVQEESYVAPLVALAITWHDGRAYVFEEHLIFEGLTHGRFVPVLASVKFT